MDSAYHRVATEEDGRTVESSKWSVLWRGINAIMTIFFLLCAYVQHNDPDPSIWIPVYVIPAVFCLAVAIYPPNVETQIWQVGTVVHFGLCVSGSLYLTVVVIYLLAEKGIDNPLVHEEGRELGGLVIIVIWLFIARFTSLGGAGNQWSSPGKSLLLLTLVLALAPLVFWGMCFVDKLQHMGHCTDMFGPQSIEL